MRVIPVASATLFFFAQKSNAFLETQSIGIFSVANEKGKRSAAGADADCALVWAMGHSSNEGTTTGTFVDRIHEICRAEL